MDFYLICREVSFSAVRSRGPGGQNVNRTSSAAQLRWAPALSYGLTDAEKSRLLGKWASRLTNEGEFLLRADEFRDLDANRKRCLQKLELEIRRALHVPKARKATKPTRSSRERRLKSKAIRGEVKRGRGGDWD